MMTSKVKLLIAVVALFLISGAAVYAAAADKNEGNGERRMLSANEIAAEEDGDLTMPRLLSRPTQEYPPAARDRMEQGAVTVLAVIDETGHVTEASVKISSGFAVLDEAAVEQVWQWQFAPAERKGKPIPSSILLRVVYQLE